MDPFLDSLATALAGKAATALSSAGTAALTKVRSLLQRASRDDPDARGALEAASAPDAEQPQIRALAERLDRLGQADPAFATELREAGADIHNEITAHDGSTVNTTTSTMRNNVNVNGSVQNFLHVDKIEGGVTFN